MTLSLIMSLMATFTFSLMLSFNPVTQGIFILLISLTATVMLLLMSSWYAIILFLIYISGMLVMFAYFSATSQNSKLEISFLFPSMIFMFLMFMMILILIPPHLNSNFFLSLTNSQSDLFISFNIPILTFLISALFLALICIVKICTKDKGPLRPFITYV
uniref:NADH dehydrogenase subunit 6 n=1 Tax=Paraescarpia echinospica TaxID=2080241 RepID=A0A343TEY3_9ANNE|nr:NADH dehydrogenase subunit 6 [Paraescarpia echinospica]AUW55458.1 NADH dehydrogenase subunit 6 [Paraescarpia echinospica]